MRFSKTLNGFYLLKEKDSLPFRAEGYSFSHSLEIIFQAAMHESQALATLWSDSSEKPEIRNQLIVEATEYEFISSYLNRFKPVPLKTSEFDLRERNKELISRNRFFELFTRPIEQRPLFKDEVLNKNQGYIRIQNEKLEVLAEYHDFNYPLPIEYKISFSDQWIVLETPLYKLKFKALCYSNLVYPFPQDFGRYFLGFRKNAGRKIIVKIQFRAKPLILLSLFSKKYRQHLNTVKDFISFFEEWFSADHYFERMNWHQIWVLSKVIDNMRPNLHT